MILGKVRAYALADLVRGPPVTIVVVELVRRHDLDLSV